MKIAFISSGSSIHVKKIGNYLVENGHSVTLYTLPNHNKLLNDFDKRIKIIKLPFKGKKGYYLNAPILRKKLLKEKYDLINCHYASGYGTLARLTHVHPLSLALFGSDVYDFPFKSKFNMKQVIKNLNNADVITSTSSVMEKKVREFYKENKKIYITPFGVNTNIFKPKDVKKDKVFEFGIVKKIEYTYGIDILLKAYQNFKTKYPKSKTRLTIYGRGSALNDFINQAKELKIDDTTTFKGFIPNEEVPDVLSKMDVACFPSRLDSFGVAAVESMACGIPVIASDADGFTEVIENNKTGIIVKKESVEDLVNAMEKIYLMSEKERKEMGIAGVNRVKKLYDYNDNMKTYISSIKKAIK